MRSENTYGSAVNIDDPEALAKALSELKRDTSYFDMVEELNVMSSGEVSIEPTWLHRVCTGKVHSIRNMGPRQFILFNFGMMLHAARFGEPPAWVMKWGKLALIQVFEGDHFAKLVFAELERRAVQLTDTVTFQALLIEEVSKWLEE